MDKIFNKTKKVLEGIATKLSEALMTVQGWLIGLLIVIVNFFAGYQLVLYGVLIAVAFDALFGICVARKRGEFILSELLRATIFKLAVYFNLIVVFVFIDKSDILYLSIQFNLTASSSVAETPDGLHGRPSNS